jgi:hypothetical protein
MFFGIIPHFNVILDTALKTNYVPFLLIFAILLVELASLSGSTSIRCYDNFAVSFYIV